MTRQGCLNKKENEKNCPCLEYDCDRHGICCLCASYHKKAGGKPACMR